MSVPLIDLTQRPPRSPRVRIGGYVILARTLDKGRAIACGKNGAFKFGCGMDSRFLEFVGVTADEVMTQIKAGKGDAEILEWIDANGRHKRSSLDIRIWSEMEEARVPSDLESREFFHSYHKETAPQRKDVSTWFDLLDLDDYVTFGGKA